MAQLLNVNPFQKRKLAVYNTQIQTELMAADNTGKRVECIKVRWPKRRCVS